MLKSLVGVIILPASDSIWNSAGPLDILPYLHHCLEQFTVERVFDLRLTQQKFHMIGGV